ncbi:PIN domain nuclease [Allostreptomyces psammosilenae]|uniref:Ribonuclease VapC n=1 Tax=Allostreptomyces psammosilenae TaxID=1892865 RepID=A0A853A011_9ACTN|nr:PIN domain nuclease [Allostreptomyces psammosilenae]NYI07729.1 hypothetical protein [Allostreptomyces psammosilenae]
MPSAERFLIDTSAAVRIQRPALWSVWGEAVIHGRVAICEPTEVEMLYSARSSREYDELRQALGDLYTRCPVPDDAWRRVRDLQQQLVRHGCHRSAGIADLLVVVTAQWHGLTVLHYDRDFEAVTKVTGQSVRWLAEAGSVD